MKRIGILILLIAAVTGCSSSSRVESESVTLEQKQSQLGPGMKALEAGNYQAAHEFFSNFIERNPVSKFTTSALYYDAVAQNELGQFTEASNKLQTVIRLSEARDFYLEAEALYQLGKAYEGLRDEVKALAAFLDAERRSKYLSQQIAEVEIPARIAGVYARQNQMSLADRYYNKAEAGLARLRGKSSLAKQTWISKALYEMGKITPREISETDFEGGLKSLRRSQSYLLQAIELNHSIWSAKAEQELETIYENAWKVIENYPLEDSEDKLAALKQQQSRMIDLAFILSSGLAQLNQEFLPEQDAVNPHVKKLKSFLAAFGKKLDALVSTRPVNEGLTPEAQQREGLVREGRVIDPSGSLEQKTLPKKEKK